MPEGFIVKALSGFYYVMPASGPKEIVACRARGVFKKRGITPMVGDRVVYETVGKEGTVTEVLPRSTELIRPPIANVDLAVLVFSVCEPALNLQLLDKFLVHTEHAGLETVLCLTKIDLLEGKDAAERERIGKVAEMYERIGYPVFLTSAKTGQGMNELKNRLSGHISVFSGQSGVGKSSLLNAMLPGLERETGEISLKLGRGRHTTRHVELIPLEDGGFVADTPGFSQLDFANMEAEDLSLCYREFSRLAAQCKFRGCLHLQEPGCAVIRAKETGELAPTRYEHYVQFMQEIKERKRRY